eukprot:scaffold1410_cov154-Amphora_coffeaeformis.AAC.3
MNIAQGGMYHGLCGETLGRCPGRGTGQGGRRGIGGIRLFVPMIPTHKSVFGVIVVIDDGRINVGKDKESSRLIGPRNQQGIGHFLRNSLGRHGGIVLF